MIMEEITENDEFMETTGGEDFICICGCTEFDDFNDSDADDDNDYIIACSECGTGYRFITGSSEESADIMMMKPGSGIWERDSRFSETEPEDN